MNDLYAPRDLGDGLVVRWSTPDDVERIGELGAIVFRRSETDEPNPADPMWVRDLASGRHPLTDGSLGILVEDTKANKVVASLWAMRARWRYGDVSFDVGRPEQVVADPAYRNRGLVRALFERLHAWSAHEGHAAQAITGIPYFYRQFGYEFAVDLDRNRVVMFGDIPALGKDHTEPFTLRPATADDVPFIAELYEQGRATSLVSSDVPLDYWQWMLNGVAHDSWQGWQIMVAVDEAQTLLGAVVHGSRRWGTALGVRKVLWKEPANLVAAIKPLLRALRAHAPTVQTAREATVPDRLSFSCAPNEPLDAVLATSVSSQAPPVPYAWYVRVPDLPQFLCTIAPVLERRLAASPVAGYDGEVRLDFYRGGLLMRWQAGRLASAEQWQRGTWDQAHAGFPPLVFLQLVFGRRSLDDLRYAYPDVWVENDAELLLRTLFPTQPSHVMVLN
jgi:GNAT superfamily N-acetyltransferase